MITQDTPIGEVLDALLSLFNDPVTNPPVDLSPKWEALQTRLGN